MLNVHWEKTPENVFYAALRDTLSALHDCVLVDYTSTEASNLRHLAGF